MWIDRRHPTSLSSLAGISLIFLGLRGWFSEDFYNATPDHIQNIRLACGITVGLGILAISWAIVEKSQFGAELSSKTKRINTYAVVGIAVVAWILWGFYVWDRYLRV